VILTYTGRSQRDNTERAPSVVLDALLDACRQTFTAPAGEPVEKHLVVRHPLQPFSEKYFDGRDPLLFSYDAGQAVRAPRERQPVLPFAGSLLPDSDEEGALELTIEELAAAWTNPSKFFCRLLDLRLDLEDLALDEIEPLRVEGLEGYLVKDQILDFVLDGVDDAAALEHLRASGALPAGELGRAWFRRLRADVERLAQTIRGFGPSHPVDVDASGPGWRLTGRLDAMTGRGALRYRCANVKAKDLITGWVTHLALGASGALFVIGQDRRHRFTPVHHPEPLLADLLDGYREMRRMPPPLFEYASRAFAESGGNWWKANDGYSSDFNGKKCDLGDLHVRLAFRDRDPVAAQDPAFEAWAKRLWNPILSHLRDA
jgi:exodeoxyribonuclease V gamma subunit